VALLGEPGRPLGFSGIRCLTERHVDVSIFKLFRFALRPSCDTVMIVPFFVTVFAPVVRTSSPGWGLLFTGGMVMLA
jgi:hypothetical protein